VARVIRSTAVALVVAAAWAPGCTASPTTPSNSAPFSQSDLVVGNDPAAASGNSLMVNYTGWLYDASQPAQKGAQFDASGATPFTFTLGTGQVIEGWDQGVVGMKVGGIRRLVIPPSLAYGASRHGIIPPNATLVFEIQLISLQ
jgi:FKBP-type peptidyl-prolyl cis-trans isomerase